MNQSRGHSNSCFCNRCPAATDRKVYINDEDVQLAVRYYIVRGIRRRTNERTRERAFVLGMGYRHRNASLVTKGRCLSLSLSICHSDRRACLSVHSSSTPYLSVYRHQLRYESIIQTEGAVFTHRNHQPCVRLRIPTFRIFG